MEALLTPAPLLRPEMPPLVVNCLQVGMGQLKVGVRTDQLEAVLGSCVGIAFVWQKGGRCGLAHCLLPEAPEALAVLPESLVSARYVSHAVPALLRLMGAREADYPDIEVVLAGGATMLDARSSRLQVGQRNTDAAHKYLSRCGLNVSHCQLGGRHGRTMRIDCAAQRVVVRNIRQTD